MSTPEVLKVSDTNHSTVRFRLFSPEVPYSTEVASYLGINISQVLADPKQLAMTTVMGPFMESRYRSSEMLIEKYLTEYSSKMPLLQPTVVEFAVGYNLHSHTIAKKFPYVQYIATDEHTESLAKRAALEEKLKLRLPNVSTLRLDAVNGDGYKDVIAQVRPGARGVLFVEGLWRYINFEQKRKHLAIASDLLRHMGESVYITPDAITIAEYRESVGLQNAAREGNAAYSKNLGIKFEDNMFSDEKHRESFLAECGLALREIRLQGDIVPTLSCYDELSQLVQRTPEQWAEIKSMIAKRQLFVLELAK